MILLDANSKIYNFPFATVDSPEDMWRRLDEAVKSYAELMDPMADPRRENEDALVLNIADALDWLVANTTFDVEAISANEFDYLMFSDVLEGGPRKVWSFVIAHIGKELITRNYAQGWAQEDEHPVFDLMYPYLADLGDSLYVLTPVPLNFETHWARFTQAVVAQAWIDSIEKMDREDPLFSMEEGDVDLAAKQRFTCVVDEAVRFLSRNYPILGEFLGNRQYHTLSTTVPEAEKCWRVNINAAAAKLGKELANRG